MQHNGIKPLDRRHNPYHCLTEKHYAFSAFPSTLMPVIFTAV